ncbi:polysaccharide biosynthesis tyrosine autokinase [Alienimonas californiensis]|uniref:non-specific protein-tyrosine kinase n=1 Tax=Alienimonas californiensis TaxID=2527989 RepID=A0A517PFU1_9PLAN|nr:tyrosine-protein kinase domain-containing protein [Alienimonas californiensis]QDT18228.1 Tyrosine-protein kinase ptk [Alienimonas californiensis]
MPSFAASGSSFPGEDPQAEGYGRGGDGPNAPRSHAVTGYDANGGWGAQSAGGDAATEEGFQLGRLLRRRWWVLLLGLASGLGGGYLYDLYQPPVYQSVAELTVSARRTALPGSEGGGGEPEELAGEALGNYLYRAQTGPLVARAVRERRLDELPAFKGAGSPVGRILKGLEGGQVPGTRVLQLTYSGGSPEETGAVLDAVVATFVEEVREEGQSGIREAIRLISEARDQVLRDLEAAEAAHREFERTSPLVRGPDGQPLNPHAADLLALDRARDELSLELSNLTAEVESIRSSMEVGGRRAALAQMASLKRESAGENPAIAELGFEEQHLDLILQLEEARETKGENHPDIKRLENRVAALRRIEADRAGLQAGPDGTEGPSSFLDLYVAARVERARVLQSQIDKLDERYAETREAAEDVRDAESRERELRDRRNRHADLYAALVADVDQLDLLKDADTVRVTPIVPPGPGRPARAPLIRALAAGGALGLAVAFGLSYLLEQSDRRFTGPAELRAEFGLPLLGHVPEIPPRTLKEGKRIREGVPDAGLSTVLRPKSQLAESYRAVRTGLLSAARNGVKVVQVTSPDRGDGKSTLTANVAVTLGRVGKRTVLVDVDLRRPRVRRMFGLPQVAADNPGVGTAEVIADPDKLDEALVESGQPGLWLLPCAARPDHPAELLSSEAYETFLDVLRQKFDFILLDSPPVLAVSDPAATARLADGVVVVTRLHPRTRRRLGECLDTLDQAGARVLGLVVNAVPAGGEYTREVQGGYYGGYGYGAMAGRDAYYSDEGTSAPAAPALIAATPADGDAATARRSTRTPDAARSR